MKKTFEAISFYTLFNQFTFWCLFLILFIFNDKLIYYVSYLLVCLIVLIFIMITSKWESLFLNENGILLYSKSGKIEDILADDIERIGINPISFLFNTATIITIQTKDKKRYSVPLACSMTHRGKRGLIPPFFIEDEYPEFYLKECLPMCFSKLLLYVASIKNYISAMVIIFCGLFIGEFVG